MKYSSLVFQMIAIILLGTFGGQQLDKYTQNENALFTIIFTIVALVVSFIIFIREIIKK